MLTLKGPWSSPTSIQILNLYHAQKNKDSTAIEKAFAAIDADKDGLVTFEEFQRAYKE